MIRGICQVCKETKQLMPLGPDNKTVCLQCYGHAIKTDSVLCKFEKRVSPIFPESRVQFHKDNPPPVAEKE